MTATITNHKLNRLFAIALTLLLIACLVTAGLQGLRSDLITAIPISDSVTAATIGAGWGECGILAGIAIGVLAVGAGALTVGIGGALVISAGAHIAGYMCVFS